MAEGDRIDREPGGIECEAELFRRSIRICGAHGALGSIVEQIGQLSNVFLALSDEETEREKSRSGVGLRGDFHGSRPHGRRFLAEWKAQLRSRMTGSQGRILRRPLKGGRVIIVKEGVACVEIGKAE